MNPYFSCGDQHHCHQHKQLRSPGPSLTDLAGVVFGGIAIIVDTPVIESLLGPSDRTSVQQLESK